MKTICVYCSSSDAVDSAYFDAARALGAAIAARGYALVYGGTDCGLMGALAHTVSAGGGRVIGVIPAALRERGIAYEAADELIVSADLRERKATMESRADAFIALPGGFGTLEELLEILTLRQLQTHTKPIVLLNVRGFYDSLIVLFEHFYQERFSKPIRALYHLAPDVANVFDYLDTYTPVAAPTKWFSSEERDV